MKTFTTFSIPAILITGLILASGCKKKSDETIVTGPVPSVSTGNYNNVLLNTIDFTGNVTADHGYTVTKRGFCFDYSIISRKYLHLSYLLVQSYWSTICQKLKPNKMGAKMFISRYETQIYMILRIVAGFLFLWHGSQKLFDFPPAGHETPSYIVIIAGSIELFGGFLVMIGLWTRWAAFINSGVMAYAYWTAHGTHALLPILNHGELAMIYCFLFLFISSKGSGIFSVDHFLQERKLKQNL